MLSQIVAQAWKSLKIMLDDVEFSVFSRLVSWEDFDEVPDSDDVLVFKPVYFVVNQHKVNVSLLLSPKNRMVVFVSWCYRKWFSIRCLSRRLAWLIRWLEVFSLFEEEFRFCKFNKKCVNVKIMWWKKGNIIIWCCIFSK